MNTIMSTMKPVNFNPAGQFGIKSKIMPKVIEKKEEKNQELKNEISIQESTEKSTLVESFICPNCSAEFDSNPKLRGHMLKYTRNKK